jgi:hypothetical protein
MNLKTTQHYVKILDKKVSDDMIALRNKLDARSETPSAVVNCCHQYLTHVSANGQ